MIGWIQDSAGDLGAWTYAIIALLIFVEDALFVGFVVPGESALIAGGLLASLGSLDYWWVLAVAIVAAVAGDQVGYQIGRRYGRGLMTSRLGRRVSEAHWEMALRAFEKRGGPAVLIGRWTALLRALVPAVAGISGLSWRTFTTWNVAGGVLWATTIATLGYLFGHSLHTLETSLRIGNYLVVGIVVVVVAFFIRRHYVNRRSSAES